MQFELAQSDLFTAVKQANHFISTKPQLPILSCFLVEADEKSQSLSITATDLQIGLRQKIPAKVSQAGVVAIPSKIFTDLLSTLNGQISATLTDHQFQISTKEVKSVINTFPAQDYPPFPQAEGKSFTFPAEVIQAASKYVTFAASRDESRPILTTVLFEAVSPSQIVCTDGFRLSILTQEKIHFPDKALFTARSIDEISALIDHAEAKELKMTLSEGLKQAFFEFGEMQVVIRAVEGDFPNYRGIVPAKFNVKAVVDKEQFEHHIKSAMLFTKESAGIVQLLIGADQIEVIAQSTVVGNYQSTIPAKTTLESEMKIAFNGRYLLDFLQRFADTECEIQCVDSLKPAMFTLPSTPSIKYIVMPFRLNE